MLMKYVLTLSTSVLPAACALSLPHLLWIPHIYQLLKEGTPSQRLRPDKLCPCGLSLFKALSDATDAWVWWLDLTDKNFHFEMQCTCLSLDGRIPSAPFTKACRRQSVWQRCQTRSSGYILLTLSFRVALGGSPYCIELPLIWTGAFVMLGVH